MLTGNLRFRPGSISTSSRPPFLSLWLWGGFALTTGCGWNKAGTWRRAMLYVDNRDGIAKSAGPASV